LKLLVNRIRTYDICQRLFDQFTMARSLKRISGLRLCDEVVNQIEGQILNGDCQAGDKLPSESDLAEQAGISRRAIRDALKILETKGLIEVRKGSGAYVARNDYEFYLASIMDNVRSYLSDARASLVNILQFRILIEGSAVAYLAKKQDPDRLDTLKDNLETQQKALTNKNADLYNKVHLEFHAALVEGLGNPIINMLYEQVSLLIRDRMMLISHDFSVMENSISEHKEIVDRIADGDPGAAQEALDDHFRHALSNLSS
jgi:GntR family transcriptional repressor for pyruvate dehydrogenase complex